MTKSEAPALLNVGGASKSIEIPPHYSAWKHVLLDIRPGPEVDLVCDARRLGELPRGGFAAVYCSHNLEHYYRHEVPQVLRGFLHVLAEDGYCELRVPDLQAIFDRAGDSDLDPEQPLYHSAAGPVSVLDVLYGLGAEIERSAEPFFAHKTGFTAATLERALISAGFAEALVLRAPGFELRALALRGARSPRAIDALYALGAEAWAAGNHAIAERAAHEAIAIDAQLPALHYLLGCARLDGNRNEEAAAAFARCGALSPPHPLRLEAALRASLAAARADLARGRVPAAAPMPQRRPRLISLIVCSARPERFARARAAYERALAGLACEVVAIHDARSLAEGYNRAVRASRGELLVFSHDDVDVVAPDFAARLLRHWESADLVGIAGTARVRTASWLGEDAAPLRGQVGMPRAGGGWVVTVFGISGLAASGVQAMDGVWLAARRDLAESVSFDEDTFDGWHGYDFDFSFRAHLAGWRCVVANDLLVAHDSGGGFRGEWRGYAERALAKHRERLPPGAALPDQPHLCAVEVRNAAEWQMMTEHLIARAA